MSFIADLHIHSKYSRATSRSGDLEHIAEAADIKGIQVVATGDFTHPKWLEEIKTELIPAEQGLFKLKNNKSEVRFILSAEISCIYSKGGKVRKIHILVLAPDIKAVEKINKKLSEIGNLKSDGRPILGLDAKNLLEIILKADENCLFVPAHCILPDTYLHNNSGIKKIKDILIGDKVYTHQGRLKKVSQTYTRFYKGPIYNIRPYNFRIGLQTTEEHPFYAIKSYKDCKNCPHTICKPGCRYYQKRGCLHPYFKEYKPQWIQAEDIKKGDVLIFSRFNKITKDRTEINLWDYLSRKQFEVCEDKVSCRRGRIDKKIDNVIKINKKFCRLAGYYMSEGYTDSRDSIAFCFNRNENRYIEDLQFLMKEVFKLSSPRIYKRENANSVEIIYFSKILAEIFGKLFYNDPATKRAHTKCLPFWMLNLPLEKQVEIFIGWWRGDAGVTSSRELMNQMKIILLRLGIIPSIRELTKEVFNEKYAHLYKRENRVIKARHSSFAFNQLSFFEDLFGLLKAPEFKRFDYKLNRRHGWIDKKNIYLPIRDIEVKNYEGEVHNIEVEEDNSYLSEFATVHNCMTPWFALFGSKSGFDSVEECFEDLSPHIYALETGLSADPKMVWRIPDGRRLTLLSNSDAHSPGKLGREANVFETELSYNSIIQAIKEKDNKKFLYTIEFFPEEGKYHFDGHRTCDISLTPEESKKYNNVCPSCGKPLTLGVAHRIKDLADREEGFVPKNAIPYKSLIPLKEIIGEAFSCGPNTKKVALEYDLLIKNLKNEFNILLDASFEELQKIAHSQVAEGIIRTRQGKVIIEPGYDGVFGKISIFSQKEKKKIISQKVLFD
ncbi:hypothetical protein KKC63_01065 [Patescibacteria group bacterium]|nr:hypothetical protein [Patescibacteria group bacterium]MBU4023290.1 hypothetical protein [Patescibacteria group bacterium]MBU4078130.1 hypothetical protein [Patescibacteria group bacterium]